MSSDITEPQRLVLQACLCADDEFPQALRAWEGSIELDDIDYGTMRLVPYLYRKIERLGVPARDLGRLRGIYARFWALHHVKAVPALDAIAELPVPYLVLKGTALQALAYGNDPATRPSDDVDVLVRPSQREAALRYLLRDGFDFEVELPMETILNLRKGASLLKAGVAVDLHWNPLYWSRDLALVDRIFERATPIDYRGRELKSLGVTDTLFHTVTHGFGVNSVPPIRWVLDAALLIKQHEIDWPLFVAEAKASGWARATASQLRILRDEFAVKVPSDVIAGLASAPGAFDFWLQRVNLYTGSIWVKRLVRLAGWDARVFASNTQRRQSIKPTLGLMWREFNWLRKRSQLAK